jgi:glycosyltransferase involved in cell wall biosynthesis
MMSTHFILFFEPWAVLRTTNSRRRHSRFKRNIRLPSMLEITLDHLNSASIQQTRTYELVIVDNGSKDDTSALALKLVQQHLNSDIRVVTLDKNLHQRTDESLIC